MKDAFYFKQFVVRQDRCAMKVGTDGVLLGSWAEGGTSVLDVGTGTGLIALMLAQRFPCSRIDALEIDEDAALQAKENVAASKYAAQISVLTGALQTFRPLHAYDAIVCNPPFFINSLQSPDSRRAVARNAESLTTANLMEFARNYLTPEGTLSIVIPADLVSNVIGEASLEGLILTRRLLLKTTPRKPFKRALLAFSPTRNHDPELSEHNLLKPDGSRSTWYEDLTKDFYKH